MTKNLYYLFSLFYHYFTDSIFENVWVALNFQFCFGLGILLGITVLSLISFCNPFHFWRKLFSSLYWIMRVVLNFHNNFTINMKSGINFKIDYDKDLIHSKEGSCLFQKDILKFLESISVNLWIIQKYSRWGPFTFLKVERYNLLQQGTNPLKLYNCTDITFISESNGLCMLSIHVCRIRSLT